MTIRVLPLRELVPPALVDVLGEGKVLNSIVESIAEAARDHWIQLAGSTFRRTLRDYVNGIQPVKMRAGSAVVSLVGNWPNKLENGMSAYDQRATLLGPRVPVVPPGERGKHPILEKRGEGATARYITAGYYRHIPFRHLAPGDASTLGTQMGSALGRHMPEEVAQRLGEMVYKLAKELEPYRTVYGGYPKGADPFAQGGYFEEDQPLAEGVGRARRLHFPKEEYGQEAELLTKYYGGMVREQKMYQRKDQGQYLTFRTISTRGKPWRHPKLPAQKLAAKVSQHVARIAEQSFSAFARGSEG